MSSYYGLSDTHIMNMPIKRFWLFSECIDRIKSADDLRFMSNQSALTSNDGFEKRIFELSSAVGSVIVKDFERDEEGIRQLKMMLAR